MSENKSEVREIASGLIVHIEGFPFRLEETARFSGANWGLIDSPQQRLPSCDAAQKNDGRDYEFRPGVLLGQTPDIEVTYHGPSRRERIATAALQGLASYYGMDRRESMASCAVKLADALIAELDRKGEEG